jgi:hypothetical protein
MRRYMKMSNIDIGYKYSIEVLLNLNHDRYKTYFAQFMVLHLGIFTAMNADKLSKLIPLFAVIGMALSVIWFIVLIKITLDIKKLWGLIEKYEKSSEQSIKVHESSSRFLGSSWLMLIVPLLFFIVHICIMQSGL